MPGFQEVQIKGKEITRNVTALGLPIQGKLYGATTNPVHTEVTVTSGGELKQTLKLSGKEPEEKQGSLIQFDDAESGTDMQITAESGSVVRCGRNLLNYNQADFAGTDIYLPPGDYSTFGESDTGTTQLNIQFTYADGTNSNQAIIHSGVNKLSRTFHIDQPVSRISSIYEVPGTGEARTNIRLQLEAGTEVHSYEAYTGSTLEAGQSIAIPVLDGMNSVFSGSGNNIQVQYLKASAPLSMGGVIVDTGENYTDSIGQKWICDEFDFTSQTLTKRVRNGAVLDQPETLTKDLTGYPPQLVSWAGTMILACSGGEMVLDFKEAAE